MTLRPVRRSEVEIAVRPLPHHLNKQEAEQEAKKRRRKFDGPARDTMHEFGITEENAISMASRDSYDKAIDDFLREARLKDLKMASTVLDAKLVAYFDQRYLEGKGVGTGSRLVSALQFRVPSLCHKGVQQLPRSMRALKGWSRLAPAATRQPLPWIVCMAIGNTLLAQSGIAHAIAWLLMVDCYLRPSEALRLRTEQFILPTGRLHMDSVALHLNPQELRIRSKTGELDESVIISRRWFSDAVATWIRRRPRGPAFGVELVQMRAAFLRATSELGLDALRPVLYMGRHSGASIDRLEARHSLEEVKKRGRWRTDASIRRYEKRALVQKVLNSMSQKSLAKCDQVGGRLPAALAARCAATSWHKEVGGVARGSSSSCFRGLEASGKN